MKGTKILTAFMGLQGLFLLSNCCGFNDQGPPPHFRRTGMELQNIISNFHMFQKPDDWSTDTLVQSAQHYGIGMRFNINYTASANHSGWGNNAFATTCASERDPGWKGAKEHFTSISITSTSHFDADHPAGSELSHLFRYVESGATTTLDTLLSDLPMYRHYVATQWRFPFMLSQLPTQDSIFVFRVQLGLSNGTEFDALTPTVVFRP